LAPIFTSFSRKVVKFQLRIDRGSANCRREFARLTDRMGLLSPQEMRAVDMAMRIQLGLAA
jgi:hypothetical protein